MANSTTIFRAKDISRAFGEMQSEGVSLLRGMLDESFRAALEAELMGGPFEQAKENISVVQQNFERFAFLDRVESLHNLEELRIQTQEMIRQSLDGWRARDVVVQRYSQDGYLSAHRDLKRHPGVIAIYTVVGSCDFQVLAGRYGSVLLGHRVYPGDLVLLRGSNPAGDGIDPRPFHRVGGSICDRYRISATFRDNHAPDKPISGFSYRNLLEEKGGA